LEKVLYSNLPSSFKQQITHFIEPTDCCHPRSPENVFRGNRYQNMLAPFNSPVVRGPPTDFSPLEFLMYFSWLKKCHWNPKIDQYTQCGSSKGAGFYWKLIVGIPRKEEKETPKKPPNKTGSQIKSSTKKSFAVVRTKIRVKQCELYCWWQGREDIAYSATSI